MLALFCLAINIALRRINDRLPPGAQITAYLDDIYVICDPDEVAYVLATVRHVPEGEQHHMPLYGSRVVLHTAIGRDGDVRSVPILLTICVRRRASLRPHDFTRVHTSENHQSL